MSSSAPNWVEIASLVVSAITAITIGLAALQLIFHGRQIHREFENHYVERYWNLMDRRSKGFALEYKPKERDHIVVRGYLQLCEDETDLRRLGRVTDATWKYWSGSIVDQCSEPAYRAELELVNHLQYPGVRQLLESSGKMDPLKRRWIWRWTHGL